MKAKKTTDSFLSEKYNRRRVLGILATAGMIPLIGCAGQTNETENTTTTEKAGEEASTVSDAGTGTDGGGQETTVADVTPADSWAKGGTTAMTAKSNYPNPFTAALTACSLVATTTEGPCTTSTDLDREDISEGWKGLPLRLGIKVVDTSCKPLSGALVRVWHTNLEGSYSGQTPNNNMCVSDQSYTSNDFFRGVQTADSDGVVYFDSCFPGWYRGRAVHIHFQVKVNGQTTRISQLFFPEDITKEVFTDHDDYKGFGQPDTVFSNDNIMSGIPSGERDRHIMTVARMSDGVMLASKVVTVA